MAHDDECSRTKSTSDHMMSGKLLIAFSHKCERCCRIPMLLIGRHSSVPKLTTMGRTCDHMTSGWLLIAFSHKCERCCCIPMLLIGGRSFVPELPTCC